MGKVYQLWSSKIRISKLTSMSGGMYLTFNWPLHPREKCEYFYSLQALIEKIRQTGLLKLNRVTGHAK